MKLRNFKKAIRRAGYYKNHTPRILSKMYIYDDTEYAYVTCKKIKATVCFKTNATKYEKI